MKENDIKRGDFQMRALEQVTLGGRRARLNHVGLRLVLMYNFLFFDLFWLSGCTGKRWKEKGVP